MLRVINAMSGNSNVYVFPKHISYVRDLGDSVDLYTDTHARLTYQGTLEQFSRDYIRAMRSHTYEIYEEPVGGEYGIL